MEEGEKWVSIDAYCNDFLPLCKNCNEVALKAFKKHIDGSQLAAFHKLDAAQRLRRRHWVAWVLRRTGRMMLPLTVAKECHVQHG